MRQDTNYAYAVGRIKVMENRLLSQSDFDTLIEADDNAFFALLASCGYPDPRKETDGVAEDQNDLLRAYSDSLSAFFADCVREIIYFAPEPDVLSIFLLPADYNNIKTCLKYLAAVKEPDGSGIAERLVKNGNVPPDVIWDAIRQKNYSALPVGTGKAIAEAREELSKTGSGRNSDIILDRACFDQLCSAAARSSFHTRRFMGRYLEIYADWKNILSALRIRESGNDIELFRKAYLRGSLPADHFVPVFTKGFSGLENTPYLESVKEAHGRRSYTEGMPDLNELEKIADDCLADYLLAGRTEAFRINALTAYVAARQREITNVRMIIAGKRGGLPPESIRLLLRKTVN